MPDLFRKLTDNFYVAPQLRPEDFAAARALGIRTVINNRPDGESADQLPDEEARAAAEAAGLAYVHVPVPSGRMTDDHLRAFREAIDGHEGPFLAYCRSGTRSCHLWAFTAVRELPIDYILAAARTAGYDLAPAEPALRARRLRGGSRGRRPLAGVAAARAPQPFRTYRSNQARQRRQPSLAASSR